MRGIARWGVVGRAWEAIAQMAIEAIAALVNEGTLPSNSDSLEKYWRLVYERILTKWAKRLQSDPSFRYVRIMEFLTKIFVNRLPQLAVDARRNGNPMLAQAFDDLTQENR